eukprot:Rmarinus@m.16976
MHLVLQWRKRLVPTLLPQQLNQRPKSTRMTIIFTITWLTVHMTMSCTWLMGFAMPMTTAVVLLKSLLMCLILPTMRSCLMMLMMTKVIMMTVWMTTTMMMMMMCTMASLMVPVVESLVQMHSKALKRMTMILMTMVRMVKCPMERKMVKSTV